MVDDIDYTPLYANTANTRCLLIIGRTIAQNRLSYPSKLFRRRASSRRSSLPRQLLRPRATRG